MRFSKHGGTNITEHIQNAESNKENEPLHILPAHINQLCAC